MSAPSDLWDYEKSFWLDGPEFYDTHMNPEARMVFAGIGVLTGDAIRDSLAQAARWSAVDFTDTGGLTDGDTAVLTYKGMGQREGADTYVAWCASTYVKRGGVWQLLAHQQTPAD